MRLGLRYDHHAFAIFDFGLDKIVLPKPAKLINLSKAF